MLKRLLQLLIFVVLALAAAAKPVKNNHVEVDLVSSATAVLPGKELQVGVLFKMDPHWHMYWMNPGASGYAPRFKWQLPPGFQMSEPKWPLPKRMVFAELQSFVYEGQVLLPFTLRVPASVQVGKTVSLGLDVEWLACAETCVPGQASLKLELPVSATQSPGGFADLFAQTAQAMPETQGNIELRAWRLGPEKAFLEFPGMPGDKVDFFPASAEANMDTAPVWQAGKGLEIPVNAEDKALQGVVVIENGKERRGVTLDVPLAAKTPQGGGPVSTQTVASSWTLGSALPAAFLGGMILNLMPCVFPVLSLKALSLLQHNEGKGGPAWAQGWTYTAGVLISVWLIAGPILLVSKSGDRLGWGWQMQSPLFVFGMSAMFLAIALNLFGMFEVGEGLTQLASVADGKKGLSESFWSGAVATIAATPCTAPFMAGAVGFAVLQPPAVALAIFTMLGLGIAFPYLLLCGFPKSRAWLPRPGAWMESFKQLMGFPMLLATVWFIYILANLLNPEGMALGLAALVFFSLAAWIYGRWAYNPEGSVRSKGKLAAALVAVFGLGGGMYIVSHPEFQAGGPVNAGPPRADELAWVNFSPEELQKLRSEGKPVFIDFTAAWCVNCKANEKLVLARKDIVEAFKARDVVTMKADWTRRDAAITKALSEFGRTGVPFYVLYPRQGEPIVLPEVLTPQVVREAIDRS